MDNNPFSAVYGRMYISWNNYNVGCGVGGCLFVSHSDDGVNWSNPFQLNSGIFIRDVQITGTPPGPPPPQARYYSTVFIAGMDEGGGQLNNRQNYMYRSLDGGGTWTSVTMGAPFKPVGDGDCSGGSYFAKINPIWRHGASLGLAPMASSTTHTPAKAPFRRATFTMCVPPTTV